MLIIVKIFVGGIIGILINYLSDVLPVSRKFSQPLCKECNSTYTMKQYLSFSKCHQCSKRRSIRSILVPFISIAICVMLNSYPFSDLSFWATLPILVFLAVMAIIDIEHHLIIIQMSLLGFVLFFIYGLVIRGINATLVGSLIGFIITITFYLLGILFSRIVGKIRHREISEVAFGLGDVLAGTFLGFLAGPEILGAIFIALVSFGAFSLIYILVLLFSKRYHAFTSALPFAPFLILGAIMISYI